MLNQLVHLPHQWYSKTANNILARDTFYMNEASRKLKPPVICLRCAPQARKVGITCPNTPHAPNMCPVGPPMVECVFKLPVGT